MPTTDVSSAPASPVSTGSTIASAFARSGGQSSAGAAVRAPTSYGAPAAQPAGGGGIFDFLFGPSSGAQTDVGSTFASAMRNSAAQFNAGLRYTYDVPGLDQMRGSVAYATQQAARSSSAYDTAARDARSVMRQPYRPLRLDPKLFTIPRPAALPRPFGPDVAASGGGGAKMAVLAAVVAVAGLAAWRIVKRKNKGAGR